MRVLTKVYQRWTTSADRGEAGMTMIEYGLICAAIAVLVSAGVVGLGPKILAVFGSI